MDLLRHGPHRVSPTAHYTSYVWARHGLGDDRLATREGAVLYHGLRPAMALSGALGGVRLEDFLLARHGVLDHLLDAAIERGEIGSVIELASGMSGRGKRFAERYGERITYVETDLPAMAARKRLALGPLPDGHRVEELDALAPGGLERLAATLDRTQGLAVVSEGLLNYLPAAEVAGLWQSVAVAMEGFPQGLLLSDIHLEGENAGPVETVFAAALGVFVRGRIHFHFERAEEAEDALRTAGFAHATLHAPLAFAAEVPDADRAGAQKVRIVEARLR